VDASPLVDPNLVDQDGKPMENVINSQGEMFVGKKVAFKDFDPNKADRDASVDLHVMSESPH